MIAGMTKSAMRSAPLLVPLMLPVLLLAACGPNDTDPGPGGVTVAEARALDEAAEMLEEQRLPADALEEGRDAAAPAAVPSESEATGAQPAP